MRKKESKEMKEKDFKREKENLNIFFSNTYKDYYGRGAKNEGLKLQNVECKMSAFA
jgi:hypothetical protein